MFCVTCQKDLARKLSFRMLSLVTIGTANLAFPYLLSQLFFAAKKPLANVEVFVSANVVELQYHGICFPTVQTRMFGKVLFKDDPSTGTTFLHVAGVYLRVFPIMATGVLGILFSPTAGILTALLTWDHVRLDAFGCSFVVGGGKRCFV